MTQGVLMGVGKGCIFVCSVTSIGHYFTIRKAFATGIAASGGSVGKLERLNVNLSDFDKLKPF